MILTSNGFKIIREKLGRLSQSQVDRLNFLVSMIDRDKSISYAQGAYIIATAWHEVGTNLLPIEEWGKGRKLDYGRWQTNSKGQDYCYKNGNRNTVYLRSEYDHLYYGRGYVQLTWFENYERASQKLGVDFLNNPELVLREEYAIKIMILGMKEGWFTGHTLSRHISQSKKDFVNARRIINGTNKANLIARYAEIFLSALKAL